MSGSGSSKPQRTNGSETRSSTPHAAGCKPPGLAVTKSWQRLGPIGTVIPTHIHVYKKALPLSKACRQVTVDWRRLQRYSQTIYTRVPPSHSRLAALTALFTNNTYRYVTILLFKWQSANAREEVVVAPLVVYYSTDFVSHCDYDTTTTTILLCGIDNPTVNL